MGSYSIQKKLKRYMKPIKSFFFLVRNKLITSNKTDFGRLRMSVLPTDFGKKDLIFIFNIMRKK